MRIAMIVRIQQVITMPQDSKLHVNGADLSVDAECTTAAPTATESADIKTPVRQVTDRCEGAAVGSDRELDEARRLVRLFVQSKMKPLSKANN
jgi:hypothetical protein